MSAQEFRLLVKSLLVLMRKGNYEDVEKLLSESINEPYPEKAEK